MLYNDVILAFDIEVTSCWLTEDNQIIMFDENIDKEYYLKKCVPLAMCYMWQFALEDDVVYGREIEEIKDVLAEIAELYRGKLTIWVHNLSYEFQFLLNVFEFDAIFARAAHKVIYADYWRFRFRCSFYLTRLSLDAWGKSLTNSNEKKDSPIDYNVMRTPNTKLDDKIKHYGEQDVKVIVSGIREELKIYAHIADIPLTQTGKIRRKIKQIYHDNIKYHKLMTSLLPEDSREYALLKLVFAGGYTHANYIKSGRTLKKVKGKDRSSSYPAVMCTKKYPMTPWQEIEPDEIDAYMNENYSLIIDVTFCGINTACFNTYISESKCYEIIGQVVDNGRIVYADKLSMCITNVDYEIISKAYTFEKKIVNNVLMSVNDYLDIGIVEYALELYRNKTSLKGIENMADIYMTSKQEINSMFGMMVTAILQDDVTFCHGEWNVHESTPTEIDAELNELRKKPIKNFLSYSHGVYITAYARNELWKAIFEIDDDLVYADTDSAKFEGDHDFTFDRINAELLAEISKVSKDRGIDIEKFSATDNKGIVHTIGLWEDDGNYAEFKTLGAKRYAYRDNKGLHLTVSGVSKTEGVKALDDDIENFKDDFVFEPKYSKRLIMSYINDMPDVILNEGKYDEYASCYRFGINAMPSAYTVGIKDEYLDLIEIGDTISIDMDYTADQLYKIWSEKHGKTEILPD